MSSGDFHLLAFDSRFDTIFKASKILHSRIEQIRNARAAAGDKNVNPTIPEIRSTHTLYVTGSYKPFVNITSEYIKCDTRSNNQESLGANGDTLDITIPDTGYYLNDIVVNIVLPAIPASQTTGVQFRYCAYPGIRIINQAHFRADGIAIASYTSDDALLDSKFTVNKEQENSFKRCMGQHIIRTAEYTGNCYTGIFQYSDGAQSLQTSQPELNMWIPLKFWFCADPSQALINNSTSASSESRKITLKLENAANIIRAYNSSGVDISSTECASIKYVANVYANTLYVDPEIHKIIASRLTTTLIRTHKRAVIPMVAATGRLSLKELHFPAEYMFVGFRDTSTVTDFDHWCMFGRTTRPTTSGVSTIMAAASVYNTGVGSAQLVTRSCKESASDTLEPIVTTVGLNICGSTIAFPNVNTSFFTNYLPNRYPLSTLIHSPNDTSALFFPFDLYPGRDEVSGYLNLSSRNLTNAELLYTSSYISAQNRTQAIVSLRTINFLVHSSTGSMQLKFNL